MSGAVPHAVSTKDLRLKHHVQLLASLRPYSTSRIRSARRVERVIGCARCHMAGMSHRFSLSLSRSCLSSYYHDLVFLQARPWQMTVVDRCEVGSCTARSVTSASKCANSDPISCHGRALTLTYWQIGGLKKCTRARGP